MKIKSDNLMKICVNIEIFGLVINKIKRKKSFVCMKILFV